jgi:CubicO group peptidase (beta-lactamase class C family)
VWAEGFGWSEVEAKTPVTPETRFRIGTASTALTSAAAAVLMEKGRLGLDEEIQKYVPEFPKKQQSVTVRQLMGQTAGLGSDEGDDRPLLRQRCGRAAEALPCFAGDALLFAPGTQFQPSKYGWILVSAAVESAAGQPLRTFMGEQVFQPLGMGNTGAESAKDENPEGVGEPGEDAPPITAVRHLILQPLGIARERGKSTKDAATIYSAGWGPKPLVRYGLHPMRTGNLSCYAGSMAFFSTPSDLVRFGLAMNGGTLLCPETVKMLQTPQLLASGKETGYGLGWELGSATLGGRTVQVAGHDGELLGRRVASLLLFRESGLVVAVMSNSSYGDARDLALKVAEAFAQPEGQ